MIVHCEIYFVFLVFMVCANHESNFTTKISRSMVCCSTCGYVKPEAPQKQYYARRGTHMTK